MTEFNQRTKSDTLYLDIAANGNGDEKATLTVEALRRLSERGHDSASILEVGPGGGSSTESLCKFLDIDPLKGIKLDVAYLELDGVESRSLKEARARLHAFAPSRFVKGDIKRLNDYFTTEEFDIVSASAVLHEVYSYGGGYGAIDTAISQITQELQPNGFFAYRDVLSIENRSIHERTRHIYDREAWVRFIKLFLPHYLQHATHPYHRHEDRLVLEQDSKRIELSEIDMGHDLSITGPVGLLREIQRHYITMRDYAWRTGVLGVTPILEGERANDWTDLRRGHKRVHFTLNQEDRLLESLSEPDVEAGVRVVDGHIFDSTTEVLLGKFLADVCDGKKSDSTFIWNEWLKREGAETYAYMSLSSLLGSFAIESLVSSNGDKVLLPVKSEDVRMIPRAYYNHFLESQLSNPLKDGKQLVLFEAIDLKSRDSDTKDKMAEALNTLSEYCTKATLAEIYTVIRERY